MEDWKTYQQWGEIMNITAEAARKRIRRHPDEWETMSPLNSKEVFARRREDAPPLEMSGRPEIAVQAHAPRPLPTLQPIRVELDTQALADAVREALGSSVRAVDEAHRETVAAWRDRALAAEQRVVELEAQLARSRWRFWR